jgi:hypothetical protein
MPWLERAGQKFVHDGLASSDRFDGGFEQAIPPKTS